MWAIVKSVTSILTGVFGCRCVCTGSNSGALHNAERAFTPLSLGLALCDLNSSRHLLVSAFFPEVGRCFSALAFCASQKASVSSVLCYLRNQVTCVMRQLPPNCLIPAGKAVLRAQFWVFFYFVIWSTVFLLRLAFRKRDMGR